MGPAQGSFDVRHSIITGVGIRDQVSIKTLKQFPGILTAPAAGIKEKMLPGFLRLLHCA